MGRIIVHTHGRPRERAYARLVDIYTERLVARGVKLNQHSEKLSHDEYVRKLEVAAEDATLILLDESGDSGTTEWFTTCWKNWKLSNTNIHLAIGPVDGYDSYVTKQYATIGLGPLTMTYEMAAVVLLEQLYRASESERGTPYHRD